MEAVSVLVILAGVGLLVFLIYRNKQNMNQTIASGKAKQRDKDFYKQEHYFTCSIGDITSIGNVIDRNILSEYSISFEPKYEAGVIVFHNNSLGGSFGAALRYIGTDESGLHRYKFQIEAWKEGQTGFSYKDFIGGNVLLTDIEKSFLKLDEETKISRKYATYKSKTKFI